MKINKNKREVVRRRTKTKIPKKQRSSILKGVHKDSPSLIRAYQLTQKASRVGFDWPDLKGVLKKMDEEIEEFKEALSFRNPRRIREEMGDLLFILVNIARFLRMNPEKALEKTIEKFTSRFRYIKKSLREEGKSIHGSTITEMDQLWEEAKRKEK
jgi:tetrapyrrole methylase family protein/MazG family protein